MEVDIQMFKDSSWYLVIVHARKDNMINKLSDTYCIFQWASENGHLSFELAYTLSLLVVMSAQWELKNYRSTVAASVSDVFNRTSEI